MRIVERAYNFHLIGLVMLAVIAVSRRYNVNPDNVATPIAAALGDLVTLSLLACVALFLTSTSNSLIIAILIGYITLIPICSLKANKNIHTAEILRNGSFVNACGGSNAFRGLSSY